MEAIRAAREWLARGVAAPAPAHPGRPRWTLRWRRRWLLRWSSNLRLIAPVQDQAEPLQARGERGLLRLQLGLRCIGLFQLKNHVRLHGGDAIVQRRHLRLNAFVGAIDSVLLELDEPGDRIAEGGEIRRECAEAGARGRKSV